MTNAPPFLPNKQRYLVLPDEISEKETTVGSYTITEQKDIHAKPSEGTVVAIGKNCQEFPLGAKVLYPKYSGCEQSFDGTKYLILAESEILGQRRTARRPNVWLDFFNGF